MKSVINISKVIQTVANGMNSISDQKLQSLQPYFKKYRNQISNFLLYAKEAKQQSPFAKKYKLAKKKPSLNKIARNKSASNLKADIEDVLITHFVNQFNNVQSYLLNYKKEINVLGCLKDNVWNNKKTLQLVVSDLII